MNPSILDCYAQADELTTLDAHLVNALPSTVPQLTAIVQGLLLHRFVADSMYGVTVAPGREAEVHLRYASQIVDGILAIDAQDLQYARVPDK